MISKKFLTSTIVYTISSALPTAASFLLLPFYTKTNLLAISDFGALSLYIALSLLVQVIAGMSLDFYVGVAYHDLKDKPIELREKIASLNGYLILMGVVIILIFLVTGNIFIHYYFQNPNPSSLRFTIMSVLTGIFNAHFKFYNSLLVNKEKPTRYFLSNVVNFVTTVLFSLIILVKFPLTLEGPLWGRLLSGVAIFAWSFADVTWNYGISFKRKFLEPVFKFCIPLIITAMFQWVLGYSDRYIIKPLLFNKEVAIFDLAVRFTMLINFSLDGLGSAMTPKLFSLFKREQTLDTQKEINKYYSGFSLFSIIIIATNIFILPFILPLFISSEKYLQAFLYFGIISAGILTRSIQNLFIYPIHFQRQTVKLIWINGISAVMQIIISYVLVVNYKLHGAAFALNIVKVLQLLLFLFFCHSFIAPGLNKNKMILLPLAMLILISVGELFITNYGTQMHLIHGLELILVIIFTYIVYRNELSGLLKWSLGLLKSRIDIA